MKEFSVVVGMIVKNESHVILDSMTLLLEKEKVDGFIIIDTGSTDDTVDKINKFFEQNKSKLKFNKVVEHIFKTCKCHPKSKSKNRNFFDFGENRTYLLEECSKYHKLFDYVFLFDADDTIEGEMNLKKKLGNYELYNCLFGSKIINYLRTAVCKNRKHKPYQFECVLHEYIDKREQPEGIIEGDYSIISGKTGDRSKDPEKYKKDALIFEEIIKVTPTTDKNYNRYLYYCGQSWRDYKDYDKAYYWFEKRIQIKGWVEENYVSYKNMIEILLAKERTEENISLIKDLCLKSSLDHTGRAETLYHYAELIALADKEGAINVLKKCFEEKKFNNTYLFCDRYVYDFSIPYLISSLSEDDNDVIYYGNHFIQNKINENLIENNLDKVNNIQNKIMMSKRKLSGAKSFYCIIHINNIENYFNKNLDELLTELSNYDYLFKDIYFYLPSNTGNNFFLRNKIKFLTPENKAALLLDTFDSSKVGEINLFYNYLSDEKFENKVLFIPEKITEVLVDQTCYLKTYINSKYCLKKHLTENGYNGVFFGSSFKNEDKIKMTFGLKNINDLEKINFYSFGSNNFGYNEVEPEKDRKLNTNLKSLEEFTKHYRTVTSEYFDNNFGVEEKINVLKSSKFYYSRLLAHLEVENGSEPTSTGGDFTIFIKNCYRIQKKESIDVADYNKVCKMMNDKNFVLNESSATLSWCKNLKNMMSLSVSPDATRPVLDTTDIDCIKEKEKILLVVKKYDQSIMDSLIKTNSNHLMKYNIDMLVFGSGVTGVVTCPIVNNIFYSENSFNMNEIQDTCVRTGCDYIFNFVGNYCFLENRNFIKDSIYLLQNEAYCQIMLTYKTLIAPATKKFDEMFYFEHEFIPNNTIPFNEVQHDNHLSRGFDTSTPSIIKCKSIVGLPRFFNDDDVFTEGLKTIYFENSVDMVKKFDINPVSNPDEGAGNKFCIDIEKRQDCVAMREEFYKQKLNITIEYSRKPIEVEGFDFVQKKDYFGNDLCLISDFNDIQFLRDKCLELGGNAFNTLGYLKNNVDASHLQPLALTNIKYKDIIGYTDGIYIKKTNS